MMRSVRKIVVVAAVVMTLVLAGCTSSTTPSPLPTSQKAVATLIAKAVQSATSTMTATYRIVDTLNGGGSAASTIFVAQKGSDVAYLEPAAITTATTGFFSYGFATCSRAIPAAAWHCSEMGPGNGPGLTEFQDDEPQLLAQALSNIPIDRYRPASAGFMIITGKRLPCLRFGSVAKVCFFSNGLIGYLTDAQAPWAGAATMLSYSGRVAADVLIPPSKPLAWTFFYDGTQAHPLLTPSAIASAAGILWLAGTYLCPGGTCSVLFRSTDEGRTWTRIGSLPETIGTLQFANRQDGYAQGVSGSLYWTGDGGRTWQVAFSHFQPVQPLLVALSGGRAYALVPKDCSATGQCTSLDLASSTVDTNSWAMRPLPLTGNEVNSKVGVAVSGSKLWVIVAAAGARALVLVSDNAGTTFSRFSSSGLEGGLDCYVTATSTTTLWGFCATGSLGYPARSTDGGRHFVTLSGWNHGNKGSAANSASLLALADDEAVFVPGTGSQVWVTRDGGKRFASLVRFPASDWSTDIAVDGAGTWLAAGLSPGYTADTDVLRVTANGGRSWHQVPTPKV
jgi:photosystem II stability/assembly factor-like uncharacterized protein/outer membrane murein-binding lipoprotein Lpp